jgi:hypothetical protein
MSKVYDSVLVRIRNQEDLEEFAKLMNKPNLAARVTKKNRKREFTFKKGKAGLENYED